MKKIILLLLLVLVSVTASARKSYIDVYMQSCSSSTDYSIIYAYLTGEVPKGITGFVYYNEGSSKECVRFTGSLGIVLNRLSEYGYEVEFGTDGHYLLSKEIPSNQTQIEGDVNNDSEVNIADVNRVISLILDKLRENPKLLEELGIVQPK